MWIMQGSLGGVCVCQTARMEGVGRRRGSMECLSEVVERTELEETQRGPARPDASSHGPQKHAAEQDARAWASIKADLDKYGQNATGTAIPKISEARAKARSKSKRLADWREQGWNGRWIGSTCTRSLALAHTTWLRRGRRISQPQWGGLCNARRRDRGGWFGRMRTGHGRGNGFGPPARLVSRGYYWTGGDGGGPGNLQAQGERDRLSRIWDPRSAARQSTDPCDRKYDARPSSGTSTAGLTCGGGDRSETRCG
jgi:hypothetical protein